MLDERTTAKPDDYITKDLFVQGYETVQFSLNARHAAAHKWYYFPAMKRNEAILFKQHDSDYTKQGRICFHMSVNDSKLTNHLARESIETRMICLWKNADSGVNSMPTNENTNMKMVKSPLKLAEEMSAAGFTNPFTFFFSMLIKWLWSFRVPHSRKPARDYTGNPKDYLSTFVDTVKIIPYWPDTGKQWAVSMLKTDPNDIEVGIKLITKELVRDALGYQKTKACSKEHKEEIFDFLVSNEDYMKVAKDKFDALQKKFK